MEKVLDEFFQAKTRRVIAIKGKWGVGKTYFWKDYLHRHASQLPYRAAAYVSLFGLDSLMEVKQAIIAKATLLGDKKAIKQGFKTLTYVSPFLMQLPKVKDYSPLLQQVESLLGKNILACTNSDSPIDVSIIIVVGASSFKCVGYWIVYPSELLPVVNMRDHKIVVEYDAVDKELNRPTSDRIHVNYRWGFGAARDWIVRSHKETVPDPISYYLDVTIPIEMVQLGHGNAFAVHRDLGSIRERPSIIHQFYGSGNELSIFKRAIEFRISYINECSVVQYLKIPSQ